MTAIHPGTLRRFTGYPNKGVVFLYVGSYSYYGGNFLGPDPLTFLGRTEINRHVGSLERVEGREHDLYPEIYSRITTGGIMPY